MAERKNNTGRGLIVASGLLILSKLKWLIALLKFSKFGGMIISLLISLGAYAVFFGWKFGVVLIYLLFIHEMGHLVAAKQKGIKTSPAVFIPFMGALIGMKEQPKDAATEAYLAYGGPLAGLISVVPAIILYHFTGQLIWALVIMLGAMLNLFNLFPISPLDGGRVVAVLSPHMWLLGLVGVLVFAYFFPSVILIFIIIFGFFSWWRRIREDYMMKTIDLQAEARRVLIEKIKELGKDLFYQYYTDEEGPMVNHVMKGFLTRQISEDQALIQDKLSRMKKWYIPFLQDKSRLLREKYLIQLQMNQLLFQIIEAIQGTEDISMQVAEQDHVIQQLRKQQDRINKYYHSTLRTKLIVFIAYILLAGALGALFVYGQSILNDYSFNTPFS
ncbi:site-2 protease family protein [Pullulanibacillus camelliae]|uniref:Site-2 protease family protein n=1 Tax=Pullulanibacillus camelliae TaxID=1707096 RepID=A0A8J2VN81_9BACL|nr:site-2 protease family protein [Pullulanibacillus camelliae]GGE34274.1 site-2 protease family protein [Pullulanibacillus camelliae]